jgi:hypothetical protein
MPGHQPTHHTLDSPRTFLQQRLSKAAITFCATSEVPSGGQQEYSADEIRELEEQHRDNFTQAEGSTIEAYFLIVDGTFEEQEKVLGIAYNNTSRAFFVPKIDEVSGGLTHPPQFKVEGTVFRHEFAHTLGLIGNGTSTQSSHKTSGSAHCTEDSCLMEPEVDTSGFFANIFDGDIPNLQQFCIEDLQSNGEK